MAAFGGFAGFDFGKLPKASPSPIVEEEVSLLAQEDTDMKYPTAYRGKIERDFRENPIHDSEHVPEMHNIAREEIENIVPELVRREASRMINEAVRAMIGALRYDINTTLEIAFKDLGEMYRDKRVQKYVSDAVMKTIEKRLNSINLKIK